MVAHWMAYLLGGETGQIMPQLPQLLVVVGGRTTDTPKEEAMGVRDMVERDRLPGSFLLEGIQEG